MAFFLKKMAIFGNILTFEWKFPRWSHVLCSHFHPGHGVWRDFAVDAATGGMMMSTVTTGRAGGVSPGGVMMSTMSIGMAGGVRPVFLRLLLCTDSDILSSSL